MPEIISADDFDAAVAAAVAALTAGDLVVLPTDTVYAVVADAFQTSATRRLMAAKGSPPAPLSLLIRNPRQVIGLAREVPESADRLMASYWPGPVALMLPEQPDMPWDLGDTGGAVALRMPADELILAIAAEVGPLACSAANRRGELVTTTIEEAQVHMGDEVELLIDRGPCAPAQTTVVDCTRSEVHVLREGLVSTGDIRRVASGEVGWGQQPGAAPAATTPAAVAPDTGDETPAEAAEDAVADADDIDRSDDEQELT